MPNPRQPAKSSNFSAAFERMCNFVAISQTKSSEETLRELILQCFIVLPDEKFRSATDIVEGVEVLFGLQVAQTDIETQMDYLVAQGMLTAPAGTNFILTPEVKANLQLRLDEATSLEERVRTTWFNELSLVFPILPHEQMWKALRNYLAKSFRRHGIQAVAYLDPSIETFDEYDHGLKTLLNEALSETLGGSETSRDDAANAISAFLASVGEHPDRISYIAQLADGAFNYYSLTVDPELAEQFRQNLEPLTLFLDTNFLFGILDLHVHPLVDVSNQLIASIERHKLPFTLRYHAATAREAQSAIDYYGDRLRNRTWTQGVSRAASNTRNLSGIESKYHQRNLISPVDAETFLRPYQHFDILLREREIDIYRATSNNRLQEKADILHEYKEFLAARNRQKPEAALDHDVTVIDTAHELRNRASSTLSAGALLLTCDYLLYMFERDYSRRHSRKSTVLLPNLFVQMLRPFLPSTADFDKSFAETFAIPEFRTIGSGSAKAASRLLSLLAAYDGISESMAVKLLSNDLLLKKLAPIESSSEFQRIVEAEIVSQNNLLSEEVAALAQQIENERLDSKWEREESTRRLQVVETSLLEEKRTKQSALETIELERQAKEAAIATAAQERLSKESASVEAQHQIELRIKAETKLSIVTDIVMVIVSGAVGIGIYFALDYFQLPFLVNHQNRMSIQGLSALAVFLIVLGILRPKWRRECLGGGGLVTVVGAIFSLLDKQP